MDYFLLLMILFNRPGDIQNIVHLDTLEGKARCITAMRYYKEHPKTPRGATLSCVPVKTRVQKESVTTRYILEKEPLL
jgi:hypothetical protein